jgi:hypothetical protein
MSLIKPISFWQQATIAGTPAPPGTPYLFINGYNFYKWKGTQLGSTTAGGIAKIDITGSLDTSWTSTANPSGTQQVRFATPLGQNLYGDCRTSGGSILRKWSASTGTILATATVGNSIWGMSAREGNTFFTVTGDYDITIAGTNVAGIGKINDNLTVDTTFDTNIGTAGGGGSGGFTNSSFISADRIAVFGNFNSWNGNSSYSKFVILNYDGTRDTTFVRTGAFSDNIFGGCYQNGLWFVGGAFTTYGGNSRNRINAFNTDGSENSTFTSNLGTGFNNAVYSVRPYGTTQLLVYGVFTSYNGTATNGICILNTDGTFASNPYAGSGYTGVPSYPVYDSYLDKWYVAGDVISAYNGTSLNNFIPLNADYSINSSFVYGLGMQTATSLDASSGGNSLVRVI